MNNDSKREKHPTLKAIFLLVIGALINNISTVIFHQGWPIVIHVNGYQLSIGLALANALFILVMMILSFSLGFLYSLHLLVHGIFRSKEPPPFIFRLASWLLLPLNLYYTVRMRPAPGRIASNKDEPLEQVIKRKAQSMQEQEQLQQGKEQ